MVCRPAIGLCVPDDAQNDTAPGVVPESVVLSRTAIGVQVPLEVSFEVTDALLVDPIVVLGTSPPRALARTSVEGRRYTYTLSLDTPTAESAASIACTLIGLGGAQASGITLGSPVSLDFAAPVLSVFTPPPTPLGVGAVGSVVITVTDELSRAPELLASDGTLLDQDPTFTPPLYGFLYAVPPGATDGPVTVSVTLTDAADNVFSSGALDCFTVDVTPPVVVGSPQLIRDSARAGQLVGVVVELSEPLSQPAVVGMQGPVSTRVALPQTNVALTEHTFSRSLPSGLVDGSYVVALETFADRAGNPGLATQLGSVTVDGAAPQFVVNPDVQPRTVSGVAGFDLATVTFSLAEDLGTNPLAVGVRVGEQEPPCTVVPVAVNRFDYSCTLSSFAGSPEGGLPVTVLVTDAAGNSTFRAGPPLLVDLTAPLVVGTPQISRSDLFLRASLAANDVLLSATSPIQGGAPYVTLTFVISETLASPPTIRLDNDTLAPPEVVVGQAIGQLFTFEIHPAVSRPDGAYSVIAEVADSAGNSTELGLGTLRVDRTPPVLSQGVVDGMRYVRAPWGSATESTRVAMNATFEPDATVLVLSDGDVGFGAVLAARDLASAGTSTDLPLANGTYPKVWIALRDRAGNAHATQGVPVRNGLWVASFGGKQSGELDSNPHTLLTTGVAWETQEPWVAQTREPSTFEYAGLSSSGGGYVGQTTSSLDGGEFYGGSQPPPPVRPIPRVLAAMAYDPVSKTDVLFGGLPRSGSSALTDTWQWDGNGWRAALSGPPAVIQSAMATLDGTPFLGGVALFGGSGTSQNSSICSVWRWSGTSWFQNDGDACSGGGPFFPAPRYRHAMTFDPTRRWMIMSGGTCGSGGGGGGGFYNCGDLWVQRPVGGDTAMEWRQDLIPYPGTSSAWNRTDHGMTYDEARDVLVIYGGSESGFVSGDLWEYDMQTQVWTFFPMDSGWPEPRGQMLFTFDVGRGQIVMAGGRSGVTPRYDAWTWDGATWTELNETHCTPESTAACLFDFVYVVADGASTYDRARGQIVHFVPDNFMGSTVDILTFAGFAPGYRAAAQANFDLAQAQVQTPWVTSIAIAAIGGAIGHTMEGDEQPGALAQLWTGGPSGHWSTATANTADVTTYAALDGGLSGALARSAVEAGKVRARIISDWPAGPAIASVAVDLFELKVAYTLP